MIRGHTLVIDYDFYVNSYLGSTIPEQAFGEMAARAADALARMRRHYRVIAGDAVSEKMALCLWGTHHDRLRAGTSSVFACGKATFPKRGRLMFRF